MSFLNILGIEQKIGASREDCHRALSNTLSPESIPTWPTMYLESSGLDAGEMILRRLSGVGDLIDQDLVQLIVGEEVGHVKFGSRWFIMM